MANHCRRPRIGLLALTLELYETTAPKLRPGRERWLQEAVLPALALVAEVQFTRAVCRREDVDAVVAGYESSEVDALLVVDLTYSPSQTALSALKRTRLPIVVWNTQELTSVGDGFEPRHLGENHGVHGTQDLCSALLRSEVPFEYVTSHVSDPDGIDALNDFFVAAAAAASLRRLRVGLLGYPFPGMGDFAVDTTRLAATLGCTLAPRRHRRIQPAGRRRAADRRRIAESGVPRSLRFGGGLDRRRSGRHGKIRTVAPLTGGRPGAGCRELSLHRDGRRRSHRNASLCGGQSSDGGRRRFRRRGRRRRRGGDMAFESPFVRPPAFPKSSRSISRATAFFSATWARRTWPWRPRDGKVRLIVRSNVTRIRGRQLALITTFQPGPATLFALSQGPGGRWRFIASRIKIEEFGPLPSLSIPHCKIHGESGIRNWLTEYAKAGGPHHHAICFGDARARIRLVAGLLGAEYCEI